MVPFLMMLGAAARAGCAPDEPVDARFEVVPQAPYVRVIVELWIAGGKPGWAEEILEVLDARHVPAMLVVPATEPDAATAALLVRAREAGHGVAVALKSTELPRDRDATKALLDRMKPLRKVAGSVPTVIAPVGSRALEAMLGRSGFRSMIDSDGEPTAAPRMAGQFEGQPSTRVVLPAGPYVDACGADPHAAPFTPGAADRAGRAIVRASRVQGTPVVRVALDGAGGAATDGEVLGRWLDQVVTPSGATLVTAEQARAAALRGFRHPTTLPPLPPDPGGRMVGVDQVRAAAASLVGATQIPRTVPGDLDATETFYAFVLLLAGQTEGDAVRLGALKGPANEANSALTEPRPLSAEAVRQLAVALSKAMPTEIPAAISVDGTLLTAGELLIALGGAVRGEDPVLVGPLPNPDPNQRGLGWGDSTVP